MALTFKHLVNPNKVTLQYPEERPDLSPRWRGTHRMEVHADGRPKCVACGLCPTVCPANCIRLVGGEDDQGNRYPIVYEIDEFRCIFCGMCQEVCPVEAIHVGVALRERRVHPRSLRLRPGSSDGAGPPHCPPLGSFRSPVGMRGEPMATFSTSSSAPTSSSTSSAGWPSAAPSPW